MNANYPIHYKLERDLLFFSKSRYKDTVIDKKYVDGIAFVDTHQQYNKVPILCPNLILIVIKLKIMHVRNRENNNR